MAAVVLLFSVASFAEARPYHLLWDPNNDGITAGYLVSYGTAPGSYGSTDGIDAGNVTSFQVDLLAGTTYYFRVAAYTADHLPGPPSTELVFAVPADTTTAPSPTITPSSTSVQIGSSLTGTIANGPANRLDWVGLYAVGSSVLVDWKYLSGTQLAPGSGLAGAALTFAAPATAGLYHLRFYSNNSYTLLATSATMTVTSSVSSGAASVTLSASTVAPGASFTATIANGPGNRLDWVALYAAGATSFLDWKYMSGTTVPSASGVTGAAMTFIAPTTTGAYQLRFFSNNSYTLLATSATITVTSGGGTGGGAAAITLSSTTPAAGTSFTSTIANGPGNRLDWVGLYAVGGNTFIDWKYLNGAQVAAASGVMGAALTFTAPTTPGTYQLRLFSNNSYTLLATSPTLTVAGGGGGAATITLSATTVARGANVTATVANGPGNRLDWVAVYAVGANGFIDWKYMSGTSVPPASGVTGGALTFQMPTAPGQYNLRFFSNNSYTLLASSTTVTVP